MTSFMLSVVGVDFLAQSLPLVFPPTEQAILDQLINMTLSEQLELGVPVSAPVCANVSIIDDDLVELDTSKHFFVNLSHPDPTVLFRSSQAAEITISDDDSE